jgi:hypothetical protein
MPKGHFAMACGSKDAERKDNAEPVPKPPPGPPPVPAKTGPDYVTRFFQTPLVRPPAYPTVRPGLSKIRVKCTECGKLGHFCSESSRCTNLHMLRRLRSKSTLAMGLHQVPIGDMPVGATAGDSSSEAGTEDPKKQDELDEEEMVSVEQTPSSSSTAPAVPKKGIDSSTKGSAADLMMQAAAKAKKQKTKPKLSKKSALLKRAERSSVGYP